MFIKHLNIHIYTRTCTKTNWITVKKIRFACASMCANTVHFVPCALYKQLALGLLSVHSGIGLLPVWTIPISDQSTRFRTNIVNDIQYPIFEKLCTFVSRYLNIPQLTSAARVPCSCGQVWYLSIILNILNQINQIPAKFISDYTQSDIKVPSDVRMI